MTINGPAQVLFAFLLVAAEEQGVSSAAAARNVAERHPQGVHRPEGVDLSAAASPAADHRHDRPSVPPRCRSGTPSRSVAITSARRGPTPQGTGLYARRWFCICRGGDPNRYVASINARPRTLVLLRLPHRLLRGDRQVPSGSPHLGQMDAGSVSGATDDKIAAKLRFHTQTAGVSLTAQQPDNNVVRTAIEALAGGTRRHPVAAHQRLDEVFALPTERRRRSRSAPSR